MAGGGWHWHMGSRMVATMCFWVVVGAKVNLTIFHIWQQDWLTLDWFGQFTASQPFQSLTICMIKECARLRFEFILYKYHHTLTSESQGGQFRLKSPLRFRPRWNILDWFKNFTAAWPFQHLITSIMNGWRRVILVSGLENDHHNVLSWLGLYSTFDTKIEWLPTYLGNSQHLNPSNVSM